MALEEEFSNTQVKWAQLDNNKSFFQIEMPSQPENCFTVYR